LGNVAPPKAKNRTNRPARPCCNVMLLGCCDSHAYQVHAACGRRIGMCGYAAVPELPEDGRTCYLDMPIGRISQRAGQPARWPACPRWPAGYAGVARTLADSSSALATRKIGMCGYTAVPENERTCFCMQVTTEDNYFVLNGSQDPPTEMEIFFRCEL